MGSDFRPDPELIAVGERIRSRMPAGMTQSQLASAAEMTSDALSRALNARRGFTIAELTRIARALGDTDLHWLLTGHQNPHAESIAARHNWDPTTRSHSNPGFDADMGTIEWLRSVYVAAYPDGAPESPTLPVDPDGVRAALGDGFVRHFAERVEDALDIDVVRLAELSTAYSITIGGRHVIALRSERNWWRSNWSLAHEIGHIALAHHENPDTSTSVTTSHEKEANRFAARLLLPASLIDAHNWTTIAPETLLRFLWETGVSREALLNTLTTRGRHRSETIDRALEISTLKLLSDGFQGASSPVGTVEIFRRQQGAARRRFPASLEAALTDQVTAGAADPEILATVRGVPVDEIDFPEPSEEEQALSAMTVLSRHPGHEFWDAWLAGESTAS